MSPEERTLISQLFERLRGAATAQRDPEAEAFIRQQIAQQPYAPYAMAQAIVLQQKALEAAQQRIQQLEANAQQQSPYYGRESESGFGGQSYGGDQRPMGAPGYAPQQDYAPQQPQRSPWNTDRAPAGPAPQQPYPQQPYPQQQPSPWGGQPQQSQPWQQQPRQGSGFLGGAMQTALGVAGGAMLFQGLSGLLGGDEAKAATPTDTSSLTGNTDAADDKSGDFGGDQSGGDQGGGGWFSNLFGGGDSSSDAGNDDGGDYGGEDNGDSGDDWI